MKKRVSRVLAVLTVLAMSLALLAGCGGGDGGGSAAGGTDNGSGIGEHQWRLSHEENDGEDMDIYADLFAEKISEKSDGAITVEVFPVGTLGDTDDLFEVNASGTTEFGISDPGWTMTMIPQVGVFSLHFFFPSDISKYDELIAAAADGKSEGFAYIDQKYADQGVTNLHWFVEGGNAWTANKKLLEPADFKGVKFRTMASTIISDSYKAYGADAVSIPYTEVYSALQLGTADGQVNPLSAIYGSSFYEVQDYMMLAYPDAFIATFHANTAFWEGLTDEERALIQECANEAYDDFIAQREATLQTRMDAIADSGTEIVEFTDDMRAPFKEIAEKNRDIFTKTCDDGQEVIDLFEKDFETLGLFK